MYVCMYMLQGCGSQIIFPVIHAQGASCQVTSKGEKTKNSLFPLLYLLIYPAEDVFAQFSP